MMRFCHFALLALALISSAPCFAETIGPIDAVYTQSDPRLQKTVTLTAPRLYLGELLAEASKQTGVRISMDDHSLLSGTVVLVALRGQPLAETMNAIWSLLSHRKTQWEWQRYNSPEGYFYYLAPALTVSDTVEIFRRQTHQAFLNHAKVMLELAKMTPQERELHADEISKSLLATDKNAALALLKKPEVWSSLRFFQEIATPEKQNDVLENGEVELPFSVLPKTGKAFIRYQVAHMGWEISSIVRKPTIPQYIGFTINDLTNAGQFAPTLWLKYMEQPHPGGSYRAEGVLDGHILEKGIAAQMNAQWLLEGDQAQDDAAENQKVAAPDKPYPDAQTKDSLQWMYPASNLQTDSMALRLLQIAQATHFNLLAHLPDSHWFDPGEPYGKALRLTLNAMRDSEAHLMRKWRQNTLLIEFPAWYTQTDRSVPYALFRRLRAMPTLPDGVSTIKMMNEAMASTTTPQYYRLERDFQMLHLARCHPEVFTFAAEHPDVMSVTGIQTTKEIFAEFTRITGQYLSHDTEALRLRGVWADSLFLEARSKTGAWTTRLTFQN